MLTRNTRSLSRFGCWIARARTSGRDETRRARGDHGFHADRACGLAVCAALVWTCASAVGQQPGHVVIGQLEVEGVPPVSEALLARLRPYQNTRDATFRGWIGDGILIGTRFGNTTQLHRVETPLGARRQLTFFDEPVGAAQISPTTEPDSFIYARDVGGSEFYQLFRFDLATGESALLTDGKSRTPMSPGRETASGSRTRRPSATARTGTSTFRTSPGILRSRLQPGAPAGMRPTGRPMGNACWRSGTSPSTSPTCTKWSCKAERSPGYCPIRRPRQSQMPGTTTPVTTCSLPRTCTPKPSSCAECGAPTAKSA